jgi:hypothetical protein
VISALDQTNGWPILHRADYSNGQFFVLTVPDNFIDFYNLPEAVLNSLRQNIAGSLGPRMEGPGEISLFIYDNNSLVVESFLDEEATVHIIFDEKTEHINDVLSGEIIPVNFRAAPVFRGQKFGNDAYAFKVNIKPHSFRAFIKDPSSD